MTSFAIFFGVLQALSFSAFAEGDGNSGHSLGQLQQLSCSMCDDTELQEDLKKLRKKYGSEITDAAKEKGLSLNDEEMNQVLLKIRRVGYTKACRFGFARVTQTFKSDPKEKTGITKEQFKKMVADPKQGPFFRIEEVSKEVEKKVASVDQITFPEMKNAFVDCDTENFNEAGKKDYEVLRQEFEKFLRAGGKITQIEIACSASTLRNTCGEDKKVETISHLDLSLKRCQSLQRRLTQDVNKMIAEMNATGTKAEPLSEKNFTLDPGGENQDGTSGPLPPDGYHCSPTIHGNGEEPHDTEEKYNEYKYSRVSVEGIAPPKTVKNAVESVSYIKPSFFNCASIKTEKNEKKVYRGQCPVPEKIKRVKNPKAFKVHTAKKKKVSDAPIGDAKKPGKSSGSKSANEAQ
jgi:hypothetical protein